jgi:hypothetical protein
MEKVQKRGFIKYNTPSSEPFRTELDMNIMPQEATPLFLNFLMTYD